jgi:primosomal protein N' (replication factor Y)
LTTSDSTIGDSGDGATVVLASTSKDRVEDRLEGVGRDSGGTPRAGGLLEVAIALPVFGTFTYRDPRPGAHIAVGTQVVVPFGGRTVTGFVLGSATTPSAAIKARDIESVVGGEPAFDEQMMALCRWAADYYQAPLGEVLRAGLPQGERASAIRLVRLTAAGERAARGEHPASQIALGGIDAGEANPSLPTLPSLPTSRSAPVSLLRMLSDAGGELAWRVIAKRAGGKAARVAAELDRLEATGLVEVGDEVRDRRSPPTVPTAVAGAARAGAAGAALPARGRARRAVLDKVRGAKDGIPLRELSAPDRAHVRGLAAAGLLTIEQRRPETQPTRAWPTQTPPPPTRAQAEAIQSISAMLGKGYATFLLQGVTGSGKTEVYLRVIAEARAAGRGALVLVPEIALTPQLAGRFRARFGDDVAVLHSALPPRERLAAWRRLRAGEVGIALGARSAVFAPVRDLGVVVVDEEHDPSFKQEEGVRYHGRDLAVVRAQRAGAIAVLGSATPSLESKRNAQLGRFRQLALPERATPRPLPPVEIVDLRRHPPGADGLLSAPLAEAVAANLAAGQQTILFLNRRGFSTVVLCRACGHVIRCAQCAVSMTYHRGRDRLICHYCGSQDAVPIECPACRLPRLDRLGMGTERVEALVRERFPGARVARLDRDTAGSGGVGLANGRVRLDEVLRAMNAGEIDILVGTQMVTKGHDFGGVTLVGVLQPDQAMHLPDFRAAERVFQLLEQVAGRAGRGDRAGRVIVQTYNPEHAAVVCVRSHDYEGFVRGELAARAEVGYPPFTRMIVLRLDGPDEGRVRADARAVADAAQIRGGPRVRLRGPAEAPIARVRGRARFQVWLAAEERGPLAEAARAGAAVKLGPDVRLVVDVDPQSTL